MTAPDKAFEGWLTDVQRTYTDESGRPNLQDAWLASRKAALEEAAKEVFSNVHETNQDVYDAILALKDK